MRGLDAIGVIEALYQPGSESAWANGLLDSLAPLDQGYGLLLALIHPRARTARVLATHGNLPEMDQLVHSYRKAPASLFRSHFRPLPTVDRASRRRANEWSPHHQFLKSCGADDALGMMAAEHDGTFLFFWTPVRSVAFPGPRTIHQLTLITAHMVSATRLRAGTDPDRFSAADAILSPDGTVRDARERAAQPGSRAEISDAVRRIERARGRARHEDPEAALALWRGLVNGEWSLVDHVDTDGRRFVLARRNLPGVRDPKALEQPERDVLGYAALGHSNKFIGYMLGLAPSTVAGHIDSAQRKLGVSSRLELVTLFASARS